MAKSSTTVATRLNCPLIIILSLSSLELGYSIVTGKRVYKDPVMAAVAQTTTRYVKMSRTVFAEFDALAKSSRKRASAESLRK